MVIVECNDVVRYSAPSLDKLLQETCNKIGSRLVLFGVGAIDVGYCNSLFFELPF